MGRHVVSVMVACPRCGARGEKTYVAEARSDKIRFSTSFRCGVCGFAEESDGPSLTDDARAEFLRVEGLWTVSIRELGPRRVEAVRLLQSLLQTSPAEVARVVREGVPIFEGALVEAERIEALLKDKEVEVMTARKGSKSEPFQ